jgi:hypothetical protein
LPLVVNGLALISELLLHHHDLVRLFAKGQDCEDRSNYRADRKYDSCGSADLGSPEQRHIQKSTSAGLTTFALGIATAYKLDD